MIIHIASPSSVELQDADNFKAFKITLGGPLSQADVTAALTGIAAVDADGKTAWVSGAALKNWKGKPQPAEWQTSFDKMVDAVKKFGWVNEADGSVRAHIEGVA